MTGVLLHISHAGAASIADPLGRALSRRGISWTCFLTSDGVRTLDDPRFAATLAGARRAVVCEHSWALHMGERTPPVERGSQTTNSGLIADADRIVSL